ncbi:MAG TPA: L,D-transpeptidase/peptidoglycan binding protein [Actinomycetota bacterium]|nr:L,D-transpeptidase/peptidoglycan binding protein [Actinomycetota bacterium]
MSTHAKHKRRRGGALKVALITVGVFVLLGSGSAYAAYRYDRSAAERILPGIKVGGIDLGGATREEALLLLEQRADERLGESLVIRAAGQDWTLTPEALGVRADTSAAVEQALAVADDLSLFSRLYHRLMDEPVEGEKFKIAFAYDAASVRAFVEQAYDEIVVRPVDAEISMVDGELVTRRSRDGLELKVEAAAARIGRALSRHLTEVEIPTKVIEPEVSTASLGKTIVVDVSANTLEVYEGLKVVKEYRVATGTPGYPTPVGTFEIIDKRENPTWYNPDPDGWGADLPVSIGPGPGNPLGTRAMYLNSPGIRIHGTWSSSSIGTAASHGCIRMLISDSEELYPTIPIGTPVIVKP